MKFKNKNHQAVFNGEAHKMNRQDDVKMAVLYLLTADVQLWNASKKHIKKGNIDLDSIRVKNSNLKAYTLLCVAKDIACGTCFLSLHDLGDTDLITPKMFGTITTALKIRRYGLNGNKNNNENFSKTILLGGATSHSSSPFGMCRFYGRQQGFGL